MQTYLQGIVKGPSEEYPSADTSLAERIADRQLLGSFLDLEHTVKTGISHHVHISDPIPSAGRLLSSFCTKKRVKHFSTSA